MDTKLKNNKFRSLAVSLGIVLAASLGYLSMFPGFAEEAKYYYQGDGVQEDLWGDLCRSNYVLYKNIQESVQEKGLSYEELYLSSTEEKLSDDELADASSGDNIYETDEILRRKENLVQSLSDWETEMLNGLYQRIDYCVVDNRTGKLLKNTDRSPETVREDLLKGGQNNNPYYYFVSMEYDAGGNLQNVSVTGPDSDKVLKVLQAQAQGSSHELRDQTILVGDGRKVTLQVKRPASTTFLYGITEEQWNSMFGSNSAGGNGSYQWIREQYGAFYSTGAQGYYMIFLCLVMLAAFMMPKVFKQYGLQDSWWMRIPFEAVCVIGILVLMGVEFVITLLVRSSNNMLFRSWNRLMPASLSFTETTYPGYLILKFFVNLAPLFLLFAGGYWIAASFGSVWKMGIRGYFAQRCILFNFWMQTKGFWKKKYRQCVDELQNVDISKNTDKILIKYIILNFILLALLSSLWMFGIGVLVVYSFGLFLMARKYIGNVQRQYRKLLEITDSIASGNLNTPMRRDLGIFNAYEEQLARIQESFKRAVDEEVKSQKMKTELITNVSHDLKTPLTAIITYIDLLKDENLTEEQRREYLKTLEKKSIRLKVLIEDLFEVSKADSRNIVLNPVPLDIGNLITQVYLEHQDQLDEQHLEFRFRMPEEKVILNLDSQKTYRIFENLYVNISKYAMPHTRVYVSLENTEQGVFIELKNISASELGIHPGDLTERFVRGDSSRNTEGSGLGLAIASSFVELQGGHMKIEVDGDLFKVKINWLWHPAE